MVVDKTKLFWRNVSIVLSGTAIAQLIPVLGSLVIARLYIPQEFGSFAVWLGITRLFSVICTGRYELSLSIEGDGKDRIIGVIATLFVVLSSSSSITLLLYFIWLFNFLNEYNTNLIVIMIPTAILIAVSSIWQLWASSNGDFKYLSKMRVIQALIITLLQLLIGLVWPSAEALAIGQLAGSLISVICFIFIIPIPKKHHNYITKSRIILYLKKHRRFPLYSLPADSINTAAAQLPLIIIAARFGTDIAGYLAMTMRALGAPVALLGRAVLDVFRRHASISYNEKGECRQEYIHTFKVLTLSSLIVMIVFYFFAEDIFVIVFGDEWVISGTIAIYLLPMFALKFVSSPLSYMFYLANKQNIDLVWQLFLLGMTLFTLYLTTSYSDALIYYSFGYSILYLIYLQISYNLSKGAYSRL